VKHPRVITVGADGWLAKQLRELADESRWLVKTARSVDTAMSLVRESTLAVLLVQFEPAEDKPAPLGFIAEVHRTFPDVPVVAVADSKVSDAEQSHWAAALLDLGARYVFFPPLTKPVLEDVVSGLMTATVRRLLGDDAPLPPLPVRTRTSDDVIDLADEDAEP
jgi:hypothetical protein